jgi:hypothetical protein
MQWGCKQNSQQILFLNGDPMAPQTKVTRQATRTLQTLRGTGRVYAEKDFLCDVRYALTVHQGIIYAGFQPSAGVRDIEGTLVVVEGEPRLKVGSKLSLQMEDGRTAALVIATGGSVGGMYGIRVNALSDRR